MEPLLGGDTAAAAAGNQRRLVMALASSSFFLLFVMRTAPSIAVIAMAKELNWSLTQQGLFLSSFFYGYISTQFVGGLLAQRFGAHRTLGVCVCLAALFSLATPLACRHSLSLGLASRVVEGLAQGPCWPSLFGLLGVWVRAGGCGRWWCWWCYLPSPVVACRCPRRSWAATVPSSTLVRCSEPS